MTPVQTKIKIWEIEEVDPKIGYYLLAPDHMTVGRVVNVDDDDVEIWSLETPIKTVGKWRLLQKVKGQIA